jgi:hypothetical protein
MATYKVLQDIEAEDKLIGPLTLRQFIYAGISAVFFYLSFLVATNGAIFVVALFLPVAAVFGFLAFPWGRDQPTEVWALAKLRFMLKPRRRIWDQSGAKELVTITVPKKVAVNYTNNLSQDEVQSRLRALATTIDTRGWAIKNSGFNISAPDSDRLVAPTAGPKQVDDVSVTAADDMLDEQNNAGAKRLQTMINQSSKDRRDKIVEGLNSKDTPKKPNAPADYWFLHQPAAPTQIPSNMVTFGTQVVTPGAGLSGAAAPATGAADEADIVAELDKRKQNTEGALYGHMHTIQPLSQQPKAPAGPAAAGPAPSSPGAPPNGAATPQQNANAPVTPAGRAAILQLANNNDLNVATIAREAEKASPQNEVVIKLH